MKHKVLQWPKNKYAHEKYSLKVRGPLGLDKSQMELLRALRDVQIKLGSRAVFINCNNFHMCRHAV